MQSAASTGSSTLPEVTSMSAAELAALVRSQAETIAALQHQLDWFRRQIFGQKSERFAPEPDPTQMHLGEVLPVPAQPVEENKNIAAHTRRVAQKDGADTGEALPFFDESKVPIQTIVLVHADAKDLKSHECEIIGEKVTLSARPTARQLRDPEVPPARHQGEGDQGHPEHTGSGRYPGGEPRGRELCCWAPDG
jgi:transposase